MRRTLGSSLFRSFDVLAHDSFGVVVVVVLPAGLGGQALGFVARGGFGGVGFEAFAVLVEPGLRGVDDMIALRVGADGESQVGRGNDGEAEVVGEAATSGHCDGRVASPLRAIKLIDKQHGKARVVIRGGARARIDDAPGDGYRAVIAPERPCCRECGFEVLSHGVDFENLRRSCSHATGV
ncbi:MAG: hypothetical protein KF684_03965 [Phycisphaeraceae bacterium]|nr:hypothetical protein [Phycisphaeraceae bacterium]